MASDSGLVHGIGLRGLTASVVNATVGAGICVLPGVVGAQLGAAAGAPGATSGG